MAIYRCAACGAVIRTAVGAPAPGSCSRCRRPMDASGRPQDVDAAALISALHASPAPVLVFFVGRGIQARAVDGVAQALAGELVVLRIDPAAEPAAIEAFGIDVDPTLILFNCGAEVTRCVGSVGAIDLGGWLQTATAAAR